MIKKFNSFKDIINENHYSDLKNKYNSLGEYVEHLYNIIDDKEEFSVILGEHLKIPTKKYKSNSYKVNDYVLLEYWHREFLTPVKLIDKHGRKFTASHDIEESEIQNAPDEIITRDMIVDHFRETKDNKPYKSVPTDIRISNSVNLLNAYDQMLLVKKLQDKFEITERVKFDLDIEEGKNMSILGQIGFNSFLKVLSALNLPNIEINRESCPNDFFLMFITEKLNLDRLMTVFKRFKSMGPISDLLSKSNESLRVYFGLKYNNRLMLEYGIVKNEKRIVVGEYVLSKKNWDKLKEKKSSPLKSLHAQIAHIDIKELKKLMRIKGEISNFSPGYYNEKTNPYIENNTLVQGYEGTGQWHSGTITSKSYNEIKSTFKEWVVTQKWAKDVEFNIKPEKFWIWIKIKMK
tara:strand:+ start:2770 stop:3984 length:1215 start_codon:yes stop_codon:yes gene_type:complete